MQRMFAVCAFFEQTTVSPRYCYELQ